jgi:hypothetical protein
VPHLLPPAKGLLNHMSWERHLQMTRALLLRREGRLKAGRLRRLWRLRGWRLPSALLVLEALLLETLGRRPPQRLSTPTPSV